MHYFDYNATTPLCSSAKTAWLEATNDCWLNPSSPYRAASRVRVQLEVYRRRMAEYFGVAPDRIIFNSGATEGNNTLLRHLALRVSGGQRFAVNPTEHPSVLQTLKYLCPESICWIPLDSVGRVDLVWLEKELARGLAAVSVMAANNETGVLQNWKEINDLCHYHGVPYHCDASQWIGKLPTEGLKQVDFVTGCAHKFGGPKGVGFLILPETKVALDEGSLWGGGQEFGYRAGTEDVAGISAMLAALEAVTAPEQAVIEWRDQFIGQLKRRIRNIHCVGESAERLWNTVSLIMPEFASERWILKLERAGFWVSSGAACAAGKAGPSSVLSALGISAESSRRALRISSGPGVTQANWVALGEALELAWNQLKNESDGQKSRVISI